MTFRWQRALTVARREYLTTVRRKAFVLTLIGTPLFYALIMVVMIKPQVDETLKSLREFRALGVVDSSGLFHGAEGEIRSEFSTEAIRMGGTRQPPAPREAFVTRIQRFEQPESALAALRAGRVRQVLVIPADYLGSGRVRRYVTSENVFNDSQQERPVTRWLTRGLLAGRVDSALAERAARPTRGMDVYTLSEAGGWERRDESGALFEFLIPFIAGLLLAISIVIGGQYLLQGVSEEKESRILESMLCTLAPEDLVVGKLIGLGGAGLTLVGSWVLLLGAFSGTAAAAATQVSVSPVVLALMVTFFLLGYLFYASLMTGIGAITNNMREAQQFSFAFTFVNFVPFYMMTTLIGHPHAPLSVGLSLFPFTAPVSMLLRLTAPGSNVPWWQVALSILLLALSAYLALRAAAKVFRIGLLLYGKTPNLPEIIRWLRAA